MVELMRDVNRVLYIVYESCGKPLPRLGLESVGACR